LPADVTGTPPGIGISIPGNGRVEALGGCGVSTFATEQTKMRVKKLEKRAD